MDAASPHSARLSGLSASPEADGQELKLDGIQDPGLLLKDLSGLEIDRLYRDADGASVGIAPQELAAELLRLGLRYNYGVPPGTKATQAQIAAFCLGLQLQDLALAQACTLGRDAAWQQFIARFRAPLTQAAISITGSAAMGQELADSLNAELFGLTAALFQPMRSIVFSSGSMLPELADLPLRGSRVDHRQPGRDLRGRADADTTPGDCSSGGGAPCADVDFATEDRRGLLRIF